MSDRGLRELTDTRTVELEQDRYYFTYSAKHPPTARVDPGDVVIAQTLDASVGAIRSESDLPSLKTVRPYVNPQSGPIFVNGAMPGDTLSVEILSIEPTEKVAASWVRKDFGALVASSSTPMINPPLDEAVWPYTVEDGKLRFKAKKGGRTVEIPMKPFLGTIGTAPVLEEISSLNLGPHGGNMDCPDACAGNTLYLPVFVEGAYLFLGDAHALQGDGELCGSAVEMSSKTAIKLGLIRGRGISSPRIESPEELMAVGMGRPLEDAYRAAQKELLLWLRDDYGFDLMDAYQLVSQVGTARIGNVVSQKYTIVAKFPKKYLGA
jgi:amidase